MTDAADRNERRAGSTVLRWVIGGLTVSLLAYAALVLVAGAGVVPGQSAAEKRASSYADVNDDAEKAVVAFLTVDYTRIDEVTEAVKKRATGDFAKDYAANEVNLKAAATEAKAKTSGEVKSVGVSEIDDNTAVVFVAADSLVSNTDTAKVKKTDACPHDGKVCRYYRFKLTMAETDGEWKISQLEFVS